MSLVRKAKTSALALLAAGLTTFAPGKAEAQNMFGPVGFSAGAYYAGVGGEDSQKEIVAKGSLFGAFHVAGKKFTLGPYLTLNFARNPQEQVASDVTERDRQFIGPGTYKYRTDEFTTRTEEQYTGGFGLEAGYNVANRLELNASFGAIRKRTTTNISGNSEIVIERNGEELAREPIKGALPEKEDVAYEREFNLGLGARLLLGKDRFYGYDLYFDANAARRNGKWSLGLGFEILN